MKNKRQNGFWIIMTLFTCQMFAINFGAISQTLTQNVKGNVIDVNTSETLVGVNVILVGSQPIKGTSTDEKGNFNLTQVPVGRQSLKFSLIGYEEVIFSELLVTTGKELVLSVQLKETATELNAIVIKARKNKGDALNTMTTLSSRNFSVEETGRYAGGLDDPSRLASAFAGVSTDGNFESNAIMIRGNSPTGVLWQIEGMEVPVPSHFSNAEILGGGSITMFSNQMLSNSDFYTGAFPAEYGNALSGVFDVKLKTGNTEKYEHTFQAGILGLDAASEGPINKSKNSSYSFNYRYSTMGLVNFLLPEGGLPIYQDLCFKTAFPTKESGTFTVWGIGGLSNYKDEPETDSLNWTSQDNRKDINADFKTWISGINHKIAIGRKVVLTTMLSSSFNYQKTTEKWLRNDMELLLNGKYYYYENINVFKSVLNTNFGARHFNRTGIICKLNNYKFEMENAADGQQAEPVVDSKGNTSTIQAFTQSNIKLVQNISLNLGIHSLYLALNKTFSIEPRTGIKWQINSKNTVSFAYGEHSQTQFMNIYFVQRNKNNEIVYPNKDLDLSRSRQFVLGYERTIEPDIRLKIEPYYQRLTKIPVVENSNIAIINFQHFHTFNEVMVSKGKGTNYGIDFTFEKFLSKGYYYLLTASLFQSKYTGDDGVERNTLYNNKYVVNILYGREWTIGKEKNNTLGVSGRAYLKGGNRQTPIDLAASIEQQTVVEDMDKLYTDSDPAYYRVDASMYYRRNKLKHSTVWSLQINNLLFSPIYYTREFDYTINKVKEITDNSPFPSLSWKIEF